MLISRWTYLNGQHVASETMRVWRVIPSKEVLAIVLTVLPHSTDVTMITVQAGVLFIVTVVQIGDRICSNVYTVSSIQVDFKIFCIPE